MERRSFIKAGSAAMVAAGFQQEKWLEASAPEKENGFDLKGLTIVLADAQNARASLAGRVLIEEAFKRSGLEWSIEQQMRPANPVVYLGTRSSWSQLGPRVSRVADSARDLAAEGFSLRTGEDSAGRWIAILGADDRGLLFGVGSFLRAIEFARQSAKVNAVRLNISSSPRYPLRGHQLGYRPKTNAYDGWTVEIWEQYIRDLAIFGSNAIELIPPRSDDELDSPHFPLPPLQMMTEMSRIADSYGLDVWIWYPAMDRDYSSVATVNAAVDEWAKIFKTLPRVDAVFVPGGDPGHAEPRYLLDLLEKQKASLRKYHPKAQMWVSPQSFTAEWMDEFFTILDKPETKKWLDGVVYGPQMRISSDEFRRRVPSNYPVRFYPDITHSVSCQFPVPDWDIAYALTEGREIINPRPQSQAEILRRFLPGTIGFITYSEGCNDDVNKFIWSALSWNPQRDILDVLWDFSNYFVGREQADGFSRGLMSLEENWRGPLATNASVPVTLAQFQDLERNASPAAMGNWRFQQALYRAYYDAYIQSRLLVETGQVTRALGVLQRINELGWSLVPLNIGEGPGSKPPNGANPLFLLEEARNILQDLSAQSASRTLRGRVLELGAALFQSIKMQLAVEIYQGEAVARGANLDTLDYPVSDAPWLLARIAEICREPEVSKQLAAIRSLLCRTDPGPGGYYDELGNVSNRKHLVLGQERQTDPEFRTRPLIGFQYPCRLGSDAPLAWKRWSESLFDAPLTMRYENLDRKTHYRLRVVYSGDQPKVKMRLAANDQFEIHPYMERPWPPDPQEFDIPLEATRGGELTLSWTRPPGLGGSGRGCQVSEVWLIPITTTEHSAREKNA